MHPAIGAFFNVWGFRLEALLADFVKSADGRTQALAIMSYRYRQPLLGSQVPRSRSCNEDDNCYASETLNPRRLRAGLALRISVRGNRRWPPEIAPSKSRLPDHRA